MHRPMLATGDQCGNLFLAHPADCGPNDGRFVGASVSGNALDFVVQVAICTNDEVFVSSVFVTQI